MLTELFDRPVKITGCPRTSRLYMKRDPADASLALAVDVLAPEGDGEIIGGAQRADSLEDLEGEIEAHGLPGSPSSGTSICGDTAPSPTPGTEWGSSGAWPGSAESPICGRRAHTHGLSIGSTREGGGIRNEELGIPPHHPR